MRIIVLSVALIAIPGGACVLSAQQEPIAGGYSEAPQTDRDVISAAQFATAEESRRKRVRVTLVSIEHAERQVVAGLNYKLCLKIKSKGKIHNVTAVVYQNLKQKYSLTSWAEDGCKERS
jgi:hypothetical protein